MAINLDSFTDGVLTREDRLVNVLADYDDGELVDALGVGEESAG